MTKDRPKKMGVYVGRFNPIHKGHEAVINTMLWKYKFTNSLIMIGSANTPQSLRHFFSYTERRSYIKQLFPLVKVVGLADFPSNNDWWQAITDLLVLANIHTDEVEFFAGCEEDVLVLREYTDSITIVNRFDGTTPTVSATGLRDALIHHRDISELVNPKIGGQLKVEFDKKWKEFSKK